MKVLIPTDRLNVLEHVQLFCDVYHYPMDVLVEGETHTVYQHSLYNMLIHNVPFAIDGQLLMSHVRHRDHESISEPRGDLVVVDDNNCYMKNGDYWYPFRFQFMGDTRGQMLRSRSGYQLDLDFPIRWTTLLRFLRTFYHHRRKFTFYRYQTPYENYYGYLRSLYLEFKTIPSNDLEIIEEPRRQLQRVKDELVRRHVLSSLV